MSELPQCLRGVLPRDAVLLRSRAEVERAVEMYGRGRSVVVVQPWGSDLLSGRRRAAGLDLLERRDLILLPTWSRAVFAVEPEATALRWVLTNLVTVPPRLSRAWWPADLAVRALALPGAAALVARLAPARVVIGVLP